MAKQMPSAYVTWHLVFYVSTEMWYKSYNNQVLTCYWNHVYVELRAQLAGKTTAVVGYRLGPVWSQYDDNITVKLP